ncbi:MAG: CHASE2 domain-containing protein [Bryobacteraceae bacterium]
MKLTDRRSQLIRALYVCLALASIPIFGWSGFIQQVNASWGDVMVRLLGPVESHTASAITLAAIDDRTAAQFGGLPLDRAVLARGLERILAAEPKVLAVDLLLAERGREKSDALVAAILRRHRERVILAAALEGDPSREPRWLNPAPLFPAGRIGHVHAAADPDGVVRSVLLAKAGEGRRYWALGLEAARAALGAEGIVEDAESLRVGSRTIRASEREERKLAIRFAGPEGTFRRVSFADLVDGATDEALLRGKVVLVGVTAQGSGDRFVTPVFTGLGMSGVEIHANVIRTILDGDYLREASAGIEVLLFVGLTVSSLLTVRLLRGWRLAAALAGLSAGVPALCWIALEHSGTLLPLGSLAAVFVAAVGLSSAGEYLCESERIRQAEERQRDYAFRLQAIAHEIATPLTAIQGSSQVISEAELPDQKRIEMAGLIHKESKRLSSMLRAFLDVERMAAGGLAIRKAEADLEWLCGEVAEAARLYGARKKSRVEVDVCVRTARVDAELLSFAIYNLLTNAIKYSPAGSVVALRAKEERGAIRIEVADQGYGIAPDEQPRVFERFYRLARDRRGDEPGSGIGLALVHEIAAQHGGQVSLESKEGKGSRFVLTIPKE